MSKIINKNSTKEEMINAYSGMDVSEQNRKINGYAAAIVAKLKEGIVTGIVETKEKSDNSKKEEFM